jgi:lysyl-tRNA synthetase class 2
MIEQIKLERLKKRDNFIKANYPPYPSQVRRTHSIGEILASFSSFSRSKKKIFVTGRIMGIRVQGGLVFADILDSSGKIQAIIKKENLKDFKLFKENLDIGDFIEIGGMALLSRTNEKSLETKNLKIIVKSLRPLPSVWHGLKDVEERFRRRYLDLIFNSQIREKLILRSKIIEHLRESLAQEGFLEVETPILQPIPGGAIAQPFKTHFNAMNADFYLRIAPELYLKRLLVGGFEKIFEIGKNFRNEGMDRDHNPEFTMIELYWAYQNYEGLMAFINKWLNNLIKTLKIKEVIHSGKKIKFSGNWQKINYQDALKYYAKVDIKKLKTGEIDEIFKKVVRPKIINPTFIIKYPKVISPLAKSCVDDSEFTERFQLLVAGMELVNGFSELNDPEDQRKRMMEQEEMYRSGNLEASRFDEDFIEALEYGMPPTAGLGMGIDRLVAILSGNHTVKEAMFFPTLKPK